MKTRRLDNSHLTEKEKRHSVALVLLATLLMVTGAGIDAFIQHSLVLWGDVVAMLGFTIVGFVWGYIGATEAERSGH